MSWQRKTALAATLAVGAFLAVCEFIWPAFTSVVYKEQFPLGVLTGYFFFAPSRRRRS